MVNEYKIPNISNYPEQKNIKDKYFIPRDVANYPIKNDRPFYISFEHYLKKRCGVEKITKSGYLHKIFDWLTTPFYDLSEIMKKGKGDTIDNLGNYTFLFKDFANPDEINMREYIVAKNEGIRIIYYIDNEKKLLNIRLITHKHINIDK